MTDKKLRERLFLNEVAAIYPDFPRGIITDHERPDFLVRQETQVVGIEVVDYVRGQDNDGSPQRRNEIIWQRVADVTRTKYSTNHSDPLLVNFFWHPRRYPRQSEVELLANSAASIIVNHIPHALFDLIRIDSAMLDGTPLDGYIRSLHIMRVRNDEQSLWSFVSSGFVELQAKELEWLISAKDTKVEEYLQSCKQVWLIIVADGQLISSNADLTENVRHHSFESRFERVLFYDRLDQRIIPLVVN